MSTNYEKIAEAIAFVGNHAQEQPTLESIAAAVHTSPFHLQRLFTEWAGISPKKFLQFLTVEHAKALLAAKQHTVFDAAYETGLSGTGRLHDLFVNIEGMTPGEYRNGGQSLTISYSIQQCRFGRYLLASTGKGICNLLFFEGGDKEMIDAFKANWPSAKIKAAVDEHQQQVIDFFNNGSTDIAKIKLHLKGTAFQLKVWNALLHIPEGDLASYGNLAAYIQQPSASRAVGTAIGSNPVSYIIPCHRVIRNMGEMGGYRWGITRKKAMLAWETAKRELVYSL
ncbi:MAG: methylated-DNA--[protein]-cysteine S-methyltransferase [Chitinophagaceae bacterium]